MQAVRAVRAAPAIRAGTALAAVLLGCSAAGLAGADTATAEEYRYWSYWQADGHPWRYATVGPGGTQPADGAVEGWRFLVSAERQGNPPRSPTDFDEICRSTEPRPGSKRVAVVVDYGTAADAPDGAQPPSPRTACAVVGKDATGADVLAAVAEPRFSDDALLCAIDGYPRTGCAEAVGDEDGGDTGTPAAQDRNVPAARPGTGSEDSSRTGLYVGLALVLGLGGAAVWRMRTARHP